MKEAVSNEKFSYYLEPGYIYFTTAPSTIRTVVGSCVAVCLWDKTLNWGGMNHFLRPVIRDSEEATPRYGNVATTALLNMMEKAGCKTQNIVAQIMGGGSPGNGDKNGLGRQNIEVARKVLDRKGITVVSEDVGGNMGRKVVFDTDTGQIVTMKVHRLREGDWFSGLNLVLYKRLMAGSF